MKAKSALTLEPYQMPMFSDGEIAVLAPPKPAAPTVPLALSRLQAIDSIEWSYSRRSSLEQCMRRYFDEYYGANKLTAKAAPNKEKLHFLKGVAFRYERTGGILHKVIATYMRKAQGGDRWDFDRLYGFARKILDADLAYSRTYIATGKLDVADDKYPPVLLGEFYYNLPDAEALYSEARDRMLAGLQAFATSSAFSAQRIAGCTAGAYVERSFRLAGFLCKVTGVVDLAYWDGDTFVIVDWKLNDASGTGDDSLQLAAYALWATQDQGKCCDPSRVRIFKAHLLAGELVPFRVDAALLADARARILQDAEMMADLQEFAKGGVASAFTPCKKPAVCVLCSFREDCYGR